MTDRQTIARTFLALHNALECGTGSATVRGVPTRDTRRAWQAVRDAARTGCHGEMAPIDLRVGDWTGTI